MTGNGGPDPIFDITFSKKPGHIACWSGGKKHIAYWDVEKGKKKKGIFGGKEMTSFACITCDDKGTAFAGAANSLIYVWAGNSCKQTLGFHERGFVGAIVWIDGNLYSGGKDGRVNVIDCSNYSVTKCIDFGCLPRAIDVRDGELVVGLRTGAIVKCNLES
jgi:WD40 repeat protein